MNRPSAGQATGLAGILVGAAAISTALVAGVELNREPRADIWSNGWLLTTVCLAALAVFIVAPYFVASLFAHEEAKRIDATPRTDELRESQTRGVGGGTKKPQTSQDAETYAQSRSQARPEPAQQAQREVAEKSEHQHVESENPAGHTSLRSAFDGLGLGEYIVAPAAELGGSEPVFTDRWSHTSDGFKASPLMHLTSQSMPGFGVNVQSPEIRIGVCVACDPLPSGSSSSLLGSKLLAFLQHSPITDLIRSVIGTDEGLTWSRLAGNGALSLEAVLSLAGQEDTPVASAVLQPSVSDMRRYGRDEGIARLWLHIDPRGRDGTIRPAGLPEWYRRFFLVIGITGAFADFLVTDLGLPSWAEPAARAGVMIQTAGPISELVNAGDLSALPGGISSNQFLGYVIADEDGAPADQVARDMLRTLCDHYLHLADFEDVLESIEAQSTLIIRPMATMDFPPKAAVGPDDPDDPFQYSSSPRPLGQGLAALLPPLPGEPLDMKIVDDDWELWQGCAWIAAVKVRITNTSDKLIRLTGFELESDPGPGERPKLAQDQVDSLFRDMRRRAEVYGSSHLAPAVLHPGDSISGWFVRDAYLPYPAKAGRPRCIFRVTDSTGDKYELEIPARSPQTRRMGQE